MIRSGLERAGYEVQDARDGLEAWELFTQAPHNRRFDLLLTDVVMPEMNGRELCRRLEMQFPIRKCLFMSGYPADVIASHGLVDEGVHFIAKPFIIQDLLAAIRAVLDA